MAASSANFKDKFFLSTDFTLDWNDTYIGEYSRTSPLGINGHLQPDPILYYPRLDDRKQNFIGRNRR